jgi:type I restriction enzyme S subunit
MSRVLSNRLGDICTVINGRAYKQDELLEKGTYKVLRVGNFFTNNSWYYSNLELEEDKYCNFEDLLYAWSASFGPRIWKGNKTIYHYHIWKMVVKYNIINKSYLYYYLLNKTKSFMSSTHGSIMLHLTKSFIEDLIVLYPKDILIQKSIAKVLSNLDTKIELNNKINHELDVMAKAIYDYWFLQFDFPDENGKPYKSAGGKMVYNEDLKRKVPEGWSVLAISKWISNDKSGDWGKESEQGNYTKRVSCVRGADLNGLNGHGKLKSPTRFILEKNSRKILEAHDLIVEISGGSPAQSTGRLAFITEITLERFVNPLICSNFCKALTLKEEKYLYNFVYQWNRLYDHGVLFGWEGKTSGIKNLLFESFVNNHKEVYPKSEIVDKFYEFIKPIHSKKQKNLLENQQLTELRDWLLPMLMNGQVRVDKISRL